MDNTGSSTAQKALKLNLDAITYGTFAEIGAGQEVARWFFSVGGAAGTVAKTGSAYDMAVSDALYGPTQRDVSPTLSMAVSTSTSHPGCPRPSTLRPDSSLFLLFIRNRKAERRTLSRLRFHPDAASMRSTIRCRWPGRFPCRGTAPVCSRWKIMKIRSANCWSMPIPLSRTVNSQ